MEYSGYWKKNEKVDSNVNSSLPYGYYPDSTSSLPYGLPSEISSSSIPYGYVLQTDGSLLPPPEVSSSSQTMNPSPMMMQPLPGYPPSEPLSNPYGVLPYGVMPQDISYPYGYYPPSGPYSNVFYPQPTGPITGQINESVPITGSTGLTSKTLVPPTTSFLPISSPVESPQSVSQTSKPTQTMKPTVDSNHVETKTAIEPTPKPVDSKSVFPSSSPVSTQSVPVTASPIKKPSSRLLPPPPGDLLMRDSRPSQPKQEQTVSTPSKSKLTSDVSTRPNESKQETTRFKPSKSKPTSELSSLTSDSRVSQPKSEPAILKLSKSKPTSEVPSSSNEQPKEQVMPQTRKKTSVLKREPIFEELLQDSSIIQKKDDKNRFNSESGISFHSVKTETNDDDFNWDDFFSESSSDSGSYSSYESSSVTPSSSSSSVSRNNSVKKIPPPLPSKSALRERGTSVESWSEEPHRLIRSDSKSAPAIPPKVRPPLPVKPSLPAKPTRPSKPVPSPSPSMEMRSNLDELYGAVMQCVTVEEMERAFIFFTDLRTRSNYVITDEIKSFFHQLNRAKFVNCI